MTKYCDTILAFLNTADGAPKPIAMSHVKRMAFQMTCSRIKTLKRWIKYSEKKRSKEIAKRWLTETRVDTHVIAFRMRSTSLGSKPWRYMTYMGWANMQTIKSATAKLTMKSSALGRPRNRNLVTTKHTKTLPTIPMILAIEQIPDRTLSSDVLWPSSDFGRREDPANEDTVPESGSSVVEFV